MRSWQTRSPEDRLTICQWMGRNDLYFLLRYLLNRRDIEHPWLFQRCRDVQAEPDECLDLWARGHYKSTEITFGLTIQDILNDPEQTFGIFSHTRPIAKTFLRQIKTEFETNARLKAIYRDVLWDEPHKEAPKWSEDDGIVVKRTTNPKEATIEAWGLVDGQPTGRHFGTLIYDDVVTLESVRSAEMSQKTTESWQMSLNLGSTNARHRYIGTRYHKNDTYRHMIDIGAVKPRVFPATHNGKTDGRPVFLSADQLAAKRRMMGPYVFAAQMLQDPTADASQGFLEEWLRYWPAERWGGMNIYILVDPAGEKKKSRNHDPDYTAFEVVGLGADNNYRTLWHCRQRLNLRQRTELLFRLHRKYRPVRVGYEKVGKDSDIEHIEYIQEQENYSFEVVALPATLNKIDRIKGLQPIFEAGRWFLPAQCLVINDEGVAEDMTRTLIKYEYNDFPVATHDDMLDCKANILHPDLRAEFPMTAVPDDRPEWMKRLRAARGGTAMGQ